MTFSPNPAETSRTASNAPAEGISARRPVRPLDLGAVAPNEVTSTGPIFEHVDPISLLIDERYQRELSPKGRALIAKIVAGWDWRHGRPAGEDRAIPNEHEKEPAA